MTISSKRWNPPISKESIEAYEENPVSKIDYYARNENELTQKLWRLFDMGKVYGYAQNDGNVGRAVRYVERANDLIKEITEDMNNDK